MKVSILKTREGRNPIIAINYDIVDEAKRFLRLKYKDYKATNKKNKLDGIFNDGKKLIIGNFVYEIVKENSFMATDSEQDEESS
jgi:hypothetical protein